jgi:hypothetical protein
MFSDSAVMLSAEADAATRSTSTLFLAMISNTLFSVSCMPSVRSTPSMV